MPAAANHSPTGLCPMACRSINLAHLTLITSAEFVPRAPHANSLTGSKLGEARVVAIVHVVVDGVLAGACAAAGIKLASVRYPLK